MPIQGIENAKVLRAYCGALGRKGVAEKIIQLAQEIVKEEGAYQSTLILAGQIKALCVGCGWDSYWDEKQHIGFYKMLAEARSYTKK